MTNSTELNNIANQYGVNRVTNSRLYVQDGLRLAVCRYDDETAKWRVPLLALTKLLRFKIPPQKKSIDYNYINKAYALTGSSDLLMWRCFGDRKIVAEFFNVGNRRLFP